MNRTYVKKGLAFAVILLFISMSTIPSTGTVVKEPSLSTFYGGKTLYVGGSGPGNYTRIQDAVDNASDGDTVFVYNGTYQERVTIEKAIMLLGEDKNTTLIDGRESDGIIVLIKSSDVTVRKFMLKYGLADGFGQAFYLWNQSQLIENICISECIMYSNDKGIFFMNVSNLSITFCHIHNNQDDAVLGLGGSSNITVSNCIVHHNGEEWGSMVSPGGINFREKNGGCSNISVFDCIIHDVKGDGMLFRDSENVEIYQNHIYRNSWEGVHFGAYEKPLTNIDLHHNYICENEHRGIYVRGVGIPGLQIHDNNISGNGEEHSYHNYGGIYIQNSSYAVTIQNNTIRLNIEDGICSYSKGGTTIVGNDIAGNAERGIYLLNSAESYVSGNIISNNKRGIELCNDYVVVKRNEISNNNLGVYIVSGSETSNTIISCNNFLNNDRDAGFGYWFSYLICLFKGTNNIINENYWNRSRILPKPIFGSIDIVFKILSTHWITIPWVHFDWHPAREPYDIDGEYDNPVEKNFSWHESSEEYTESSWIEESSGTSGDSPLLWRYRCTNN